jgi:CheY-like chemotaxis protein
MSQRLVICDDDPTVRTAIRVLAEELGHVVLAETDRGGDAVALVARFGADALILDLALSVGSGYTALDEVATMAPGCPVVVFSAYCGQVSVTPPVVAVVEKPDLDRLALVLADIPPLPGARPLERRQWAAQPFAHVRPSGAISDPAAEFYTALADARPGDAVMVLRPRDQALVVATALRRTLRAQDWMLVESTRVIVLLVGGSPSALDAVKTRAGGALANCDVAEAVLGEHEAPVDMLLRLTRPLV